MRSDHPDSKYVFTIFQYLKELAIKFRDSVIMVCADYKAVIPVGEPDHAVSSGVRADNRSLGVNYNTILGALDHDWKLAGIVAPVNLFNEIPEESNESFFTGKATVITKDRLFERSTPVRHMTELCTEIREKGSKDGIKCSEQILLLCTDGGGDHKISKISVQISLICLFLQLDLDDLIAMRTCPTQMWVNPAERVMCILN